MSHFKVLVMLAFAVVTSATKATTTEKARDLAPAPSPKSTEAPNPCAPVTMAAPTPVATTVGKTAAPAPAPTPAPAASPCVTVAPPTTHTTTPEPATTMAPTTTPKATTPKATHTTTPLPTSTPASTTPETTRTTTPVATPPPTPAPFNPCAPVTTTPAPKPWNPFEAIMRLDSVEATKSKRSDVTIAQRIGNVSPLAFGLLGFIVVGVSVSMFVRRFQSRRQRPTFAGRSLTSEYNPLDSEA